MGEEKGEEEDPSVVPQGLLSLLSLLLKRVKKEEGKDPKGPIFDPYSGDGSLLSFFEKEIKEKGEGNEERLIPYYMAKEKGLSCSLSNSFLKEKPSLLASNLLNFSSLKKEVEGGGNGEKELREAFKRAKETLKDGGIALFISPSLFLENFSFPLEDLEGFSSLYSLSLRGSNGIRKEEAGENVMDERSSVSLLCLVKGEGELKARGMEVGKDLSRKEKIAQAKALLEEGEWKELGEGRKMKRRDILAGHACSQSPLFENMWDCAHINLEKAKELGKVLNYDPLKGNGSLSNICSVIAPYMEKAGCSLYNLLTKGSHSDLLTNALTAGDAAYEANKEITPDELGNVIGTKLASELSENGIKSGKGHASNGTTPRPASAKISVPTVQKVDFTSLIKPPDPDTDPEYKALLDKVSEAQIKSNALLNSDDPDVAELGVAMLELKAAKKAVVDYAYNHADFSELDKKIDELENVILENNIAYEDTYRMINALQEKARRISEIRNNAQLMLEKAQATLRAFENGTEN